MKIQYAVFGLWNILLYCHLFNFAFSFEDYYTDYADPQPLVFEYKHFAEIKRHCRSILSSGSKLILNDAKVERIKNEFSFYNGDWDQENNGLYPLMPFDATDLPLGTGSASLSLINFEVKDVKSLDDVQSGVGLGGVMSIGITRSKSFSADHRTMFSMNPGMSVLKIVFEGMYVETKGDAGERFLCMLGNTTLPTRRWLMDWQNAYWNWGHENCCPNLVQDDQLVLVLKYQGAFRER
uniref:DUF2921 domain-containing protein n=1 Tax=Chenopodium quinoa TaxID=63459 RepID=A0A803MLY5_CHEQI